LSAAHIRDYLSDLAITSNVSASTQNVPFRRRVRGAQSPGVITNRKSEPKAIKVSLTKPVESREKEPGATATGSLRNSVESRETIRSLALPVLLIQGTDREWRSYEPEGVDGEAGLPVGAAGG
jgi:hypothetical protein